jgi:hypothetical protein
MRHFLFILIVFLLFGCANIKVVKIDDHNQNQKGLRFYRPHPYLVIGRDKNDALTGQILWLPNLKEEYAIVSTPGIGDTDLKVTLENGWNLTQYGESIETRLPEMIGELGDLGELALKLQTRMPQAVEGFYRVEFKDGFVSGFTKIEFP